MGFFEFSYSRHELAYFDAKKLFLLPVEGLFKDWLSSGFGVFCKLYTSADENPKVTMYVRPAGSDPGCNHGDQ